MLHKGSNISYLHLSVNDFVHLLYLPRYLHFQYNEVAFYAWDKCLETLHNSKLTCFKTNFPIEINVKSVCGGCIL